MYNIHKCAPVLQYVYFEAQKKKMAKVQIQERISSACVRYLPLLYFTSLLVDAKTTQCTSWDIGMAVEENMICLLLQTKSRLL
jgi:hypothetical protein